MHLVIFNRWGEQIFETTTLEGGWDGTYKGVRAQEDVYTYVLYYVMNDGIAYQKYGRISLIY
jgi:gliding motility-associated-like protein